MSRDSRFVRDVMGAGLLMVAIGGCVAVPAAVTGVSAAFDGMSYVATGKAPHDHALSAVTGEDCAVWRVVKERPVCVESKGTGVKEASYGNGNALAFAPPAMTPMGVAPAPTPQSQSEKIVTETLPSPAPVPAPQVATVAPAAPLAVPPMVASAPTLQAAASPPARIAPAKARAVPTAPTSTAGSEQGRKVLVVLGSFQDADRAAAASSASKGTRVMAVTVEGRRMYRVVAGPFGPQQAKGMRRNIAGGAWLLPI